ncbi:FtsX-like permease family protein [Fulvivirga sp. M361]|uniref:ABC transporter permease n=1 Tax=Fulvivirga sp. M361 TaxID=2594266 RepID=UPI00117A51F3|nr:ABC transporter permease [Fulvivirga sp. M361]TRX56162.1 FtsX-like permease family protein [Fulvivirga sp. M361]
MSKRKPTPPWYAEHLLLWFLKEELVEEVLGDLDEKFYHTLDKSSRLKAKLNYWYQVVHYIRPFAMKKYRSNSTSFIMFQNYFKIGYRNLFKNKFTSFINVGGLAIGMSVAMLVSLWVKDELSYNKTHKNYDRLAQVMFHSNWGGTKVSTTGIVTTGLGTLLKNSYASYFEKVALVRARLEERIFTYKDDHFIENGYYMQPDGPEMFSLKMVSGSANGLKEMRSVLLSQSLAKKIFGDTDPVNQVVKFNEQTDVQVTGVYEDLPGNSKFHDAAYFAPIDLFIHGWSHLNVWDNYNMFVFVQLRDGVDFNQASTLIKDIMKPYIQEVRQHDLFLHPMSKWHLFSEFKDGKQVTSDRITFVWFYGAVGIFVLLLACVNFMNLSTARSENRAKEIGVRKSMGSARIQLFNQFLSESILVAVLAFTLSLLFVSLILSWFNSLAGKNMIMPWSEPFFWLGGLGFTLMTGLLAGSYPAIYLSSFNPVKSLKGTFRSGKNASLPRKVLVVFQFTVSIALIIGTLIVYQQIQHVKDRPVGYLRDGLLMLPKRSSELWGKHDLIRNELVKTGAVEEIGVANYPLTNTLGNNDGFSWEGNNPSEYHSFNTVLVNHDYGKTIGWELLQGRDFSRDNKSDLAGVVITESARQIMEIDNPIGISLHYEYGMNGIHDFTILGVVNDLIKGDPFKSSVPAIMFLSERDLLWMFIRIKEGYPQNEALAKIDNVFKTLTPSAYVDFKVLDEEYSAKFSSEERIGKLATFFAVLAVIISCLGLFGLALFLTEKRSKEIGIRKVLGASIIGIWRLLTQDFVGLVMISSVIAIPVAYFFLDRWISNYDYQMDISWWVFGVTCMGALLIAILTVSYQAIKSAMANPVNSLRSE